MSSRRIVVVGGGAAGVFAAITCAESHPEAKVVVLEKGSQFLSKVRISGGGRCNVSNACFDARELAAGYPRGERELIGPFMRFQPRDTIRWFESRGVKLKAESDGRLFPVSDDSQTIIDCLLASATTKGIILRPCCYVRSASRSTGGGFEVELPAGEILACDCLLLAMGGCRTAAAGNLAVGFGHSLEPPVPSLFAFNLEASCLRELAGISVESVGVSVPGTLLRDKGALLITHRGLSGPVILRLSAWGARILKEFNYHFPVHLNWLPQLSPESLNSELRALRDRRPSRLVINAPMAPLPLRLWEQLAAVVGVDRNTRWAALSRTTQTRLIRQLACTELQVAGKSRNKDEFVTCGGVRLSEVDFRTMESRICPGLYLVGELLDIDGITGGYNLQAAWTTGWIAGQAIAHQ